jgi:hypothetical protein
LIRSPSRPAIVGRLFIVRQERGAADVEMRNVCGSLKIMLRSVGYFMPDATPFRIGASDKSATRVQLQGV